MLGTGAIAREVMTRVAAFGMNIVLWSRRFDGADRALTAGEAKSLGLEDVARLGARSVWRRHPPSVAARSDVLSVHLALAPETKQLVNAAVLARLRPGSYVINTARGEIVDPAALRRRDPREEAPRRARRVRPGAGRAATGDFADPIVKEPGVIGTHHIGASTDQAQEAIAAETVRIVKTFMEHRPRLPNAVN